MFKKITLIDPKNEKAFENLGMIYYYKKDFKNALKTFDITLTLNPSNIKAVQYRNVINGK